jgi:NTE family protein
VKSSVLAAAFALALVASACAPTVQRVKAVPAPTLSELAAQRSVQATPLTRPRVGVAFGGGSARGLAHVGVIRWFEEHRIPIDLAAGTSMGALVGGAFAAGMDADELDALLASINWDDLFGSSDFAFRNLRRKADARAYPSRLEFGLKRGIIPPTSLNSGEQVDLLLARITAPYYALDQFDDLPTPFRAVAFDIASASQVILARGSLARAMRASMSLPVIFPAVEIDGRLLVDGGAMNNVPANVVRAMGADVVVAVNVGELDDPDSINVAMLQLLGSTFNALMRSAAREAVAAADLRIDVPLSAFDSLAWRRSAEIVHEGYMAAEAMREQLLPLAIGEAEFATWRNERTRRRRTMVPMPEFVTSDGFVASDRLRLDALLHRHVGVGLDVSALESDLKLLSGLDRYETITWRMVTNDAGSSGLLVTAQAKSYAPPFLMLGLNLENTTSADFGITATARYLAYDVVRSGSELRIDGTLGTNPAVGIELYEPLRKLPLFATAAGMITTDRVTTLADDQLFARYAIRRSRATLGLGANLGRQSDVRVSAFSGTVDTDIEIGNPQLPELQGSESGLAVAWRFDGQDSPVVPSTGTHAIARLLHVLDAPEGLLGDDIAPALARLDGRVTQLSGTFNRFWSLGEPHRVFFAGGIGTSFGGHAVRTDQFSLGGAFTLGSYRAGELHGSHFIVGTAGYLRQVGRLPDFLGGPVFVGGWLENGDAFDDWELAQWRKVASVGIVLDTLVGPVMLAGSAGFDGRWRTYIGVGRIFKQIPTW